MFRMLNIRGAGHHFLLPVLAILVVAGIGGFIMQRGSSAAAICKNNTYSQGARSECVRYAQKILQIKADAAYGPNTQKVIKAKTGQNSLNSTAWRKICAIGSKKSASPTAFSAYKTACLGIAAKNPSAQYKATSCKLFRNVYPKSPSIGCTTVRLTKSAAAARNADTKVKRAKYSKDLKAFRISKSYNKQGSSIDNYSRTQFKKDCAAIPGTLIKSNTVCKAK